MEFTSLPTAAGHEGAVISRVQEWVKARRHLEVIRDTAGNIIIARKDFNRACRENAPLFITAHLDHPAFVVISAKEREVKLEFRGGVHDPYFKNAVIEIFTTDLSRSFMARVVSLDSKSKPFKTVLARLPNHARLKPGGLGRWRLPIASIKGGIARTYACDDLASVTAALCAYDKISRDTKLAHTALLFTRAEEVGFVGAIGAARGGSFPKNSRLICLECSRSFPHDSPVGAGPIVRVGDRLSVFTAELTNTVSSIANSHQKNNPAFRFQRKLMAGGVCEATAFASYGISATCLCLPLGNYHNMAEVDGVLSGTRKARILPEYISVSDFHGLIELLNVVVREIDYPRPPQKDSAEAIWAEKAWIVKTLTA